MYFSNVLSDMLGHNMVTKIDNPTPVIVTNAIVTTLSVVVLCTIPVMAWAPALAAFLGSVLQLIYTDRTGWASCFLTISGTILLVTLSVWLFLMPA